MTLINEILNLAALLLWLSWRSARLLPRAESSVLSLASTLKRTAAHKTPRVLYLIFFFSLLTIRSVAYWHLGKGIHWTPTLDLIAVSLPFRSDRFLLMLVFSWLSFGLVWAVFYSWLLLLSVVNRKVADSEPLQKLVRLHLGWLERCPAAFKLLCPMVAAGLTWALLSPFLTHLGIIPGAVSGAHRWQQAALFGLASLLVWKFLLLGFMLLHLVNSYVYLGSASFLNFVSLTSRNLLSALAWLPLRANRVDLSPVAGLGIVLLAAKAGVYWLPRLYLQLPF